MNPSENNTSDGRTFELHLREVNVPEEKFLEDIRRVAAEFGAGKARSKVHTKHGKYSVDAIAHRFGSWNSAVKRAGFPLNNEVRISDLRLFENLERVWVRLARQPGRRNMVKPASDFSERPYTRRFGSWNRALQAFVSYINEAGSAMDVDADYKRGSEPQQTGRDVNLV